MEQAVSDAVASVLPPSAHVRVTVLMHLFTEHLAGRLHNAVEVFLYKRVPRADAKVEDGDPVGRMVLLAHERSQHGRLVRVELHCNAVVRVVPEGDGAGADGVMGARRHACLCDCLRTEERNI